VRLLETKRVLSEDTVQKRRSGCQNQQDVNEQSRGVRADNAQWPEHTKNNYSA